MRFSRGGRLAVLCIAGITAFAVVGGSTTSVASGARKACDVPPMVAHRGGQERFTENSLRAYAYVGDRGIRTWDVDVRFDRNDVPVLMHDATLSRTTSSSGHVRLIDVHRRSVRLESGEPVPTLDAFLRLARGYRATVFLEVKTRASRAGLHRIRKLIAKHRLQGRVLFNSFRAGRVDRIRSVMGDGFRYGWIVSNRHPQPRRVLRHGRHLFLVDRLVTKAYVKAYRHRGIRVYPWTLNRERQWRRVRSWPIAAVITDRPLAYTRWRNRVCGRVRNQPIMELY